MSNNPKFEIKINDYIAALRKTVGLSTESMSHKMQMRHSGYVAMENGYIQVKRCVYENAFSLLRHMAFNQMRFKEDSRILNLRFLSELMSLYADNQNREKYGELSTFIEKYSEMLVGGQVKPFIHDDYFTIIWTPYQEE